MSDNTRSEPVCSCGETREKEEDDRRAAASPSNNEVLRVKLALSLVVWLIS